MNVKCTRLSSSSRCLYSEGVLVIKNVTHDLQPIRTSTSCLDESRIDTLVKYDLTHSVQNSVGNNSLVEEDEQMEIDATYTCDACGEEIIVPIDISAGSHQDYVEDCPVCCHPNVIHVNVDDDGQTQVWGEAEQDRY